MNKNQKIILILVPVLIISLVSISIIAWISLRSKSSEVIDNTSTSKPKEVINQLPVEARPFIKLIPEIDGKNVTLTIQQLKQPTTEAQYELEYQAGTLLQGVQGSIELADLQLPQSKTMLFGSCSAGGACTYHTDIKGGNLLLRLISNQTDLLKFDWRYFDNLKQEPRVASKDAKFQLESSSLGSQKYAIVLDGFGYPDGLVGTPMSDPYTLQTSSTLSGKGQLVMRSQKEGAMQIAVWAENKWQYFDGTIDGKTISAEVPLGELYIVITKSLENPEEATVSDTIH